MSLIESISNKQIFTYQNSNARINILEGSVRSGKSFISLIRWLDYCRSGPSGPLVVCGRTDKTIKRNIILPLQRLVGPALEYYSGKGEAILFDRLIYLIGANDQRAEGKIQGSEFAGALVDELSLIPENFFNMLLSRLSVSGAKLFATCNPDSPYHWLKTNYIDRKDELDCKVFSFCIDDNPALDEEYKKQLKREYRGVWYKRYIEGLWVAAEGAVYDFFSEKDHVIPYPPGDAKQYFCSIDYGTKNPCVFLLFGYNPSCYPNIWLEKEYYYDSQAMQRQKSDSEYANDLINFLNGIVPTGIYIDPSAASLKVELSRNSIRNVNDAKNDVLPGIRFQGQLLANGTYKICQNCVHTIKEYANYMWDEKAIKRGFEIPIKVNDHCKDAERYFLYSRFFNNVGKPMTINDVRDLENKYYFKN